MISFPKKKERKALAEKRRQAGIKDFLSWVYECSTALNKANGKGDTKKVYKLVKGMEGKPGKPPQNISTDGQGNMLADADAVAARWFSFLKNKFKVTVAEQGRPDMPVLPQGAPDSDLTDGEVLRAISKLNTGKE